MSYINNVVAGDGLAWDTLFGITVSTLTNATKDNFLVAIKSHEKHKWAECLYLGSSALTIAEFNALPIGSVIWAPAISTPAVYLKTAAAAWKYTAINT